MFSSSIPDARIDYALTPREETLIIAKCNLVEVALI